ncbi:ABC transporter substrate-binding protein [Variovorax sp. J2P1-59]|uniref:ABC transporter substrate-binding protein n=1 Tax=Variovorax flavidus TaxID=3053501 RepID=UPI002575DAC8|nr:ABC transporter substrate-binding protein [Variovorax sp. J2P1-59]MDM0078878.1 ABC transporter substrate-binding protein [Variovorax sp. J2P1-59]
MNKIMSPGPSRREFLEHASALGAAGLLGLQHGAAVADDAPPETRTVRFCHAPSICLAPQYLAGELLRDEGFSDVQYLALGTRAGPEALASGKVDITMWYTTGYLPVMDAGKGVVLLAGVHLGCWELFGHGDMRMLSDLKGKTVVCEKFLGGDQILLSSMLSYAGFSTNDVKWLARPGGSAMNAFIDKRADAFLAFPPEPQELRARKIGQVLLDTNVDRPWSQYYCCMIGANRDYVQRNPVATKHVLRAILKAVELCKAQPQQAAGYLRDHGYETRYDIGLQSLKKLNYDYRTVNPEDTLRFHALRLRDVGLIKSTPQKLIAESTDWRLLNELKRELKA